MVITIQIASLVGHVWALIGNVCLQIVSLNKIWNFSDPIEYAIIWWENVICFYELDIFDFYMDQTKCVVVNMISQQTSEN